MHGLQFPFCGFGPRDPLKMHTYKRPHMCTRMHVHTHATPPPHTQTHTYIHNTHIHAPPLTGRYPSETIAIISSICRSAEAVFDHHQHFETIAEAEEQLLAHKRAKQVGWGGCALVAVGVGTL